jgi:hypothetical protein
MSAARRRSASVRNRPNSTQRPWEPTTGPLQRIGQRLVRVVEARIVDGGNAVGRRAARHERAGVGLDRVAQHVVAVGERKRPLDRGDDIPGTPGRGKPARLLGKHVVAADRGTDAKRLRRRDHVGFDGIVVRSPELAGPTDSRLYLVGDQRQVVFLGEFCDLGHERVAGEAVSTFALDRFDDDVGHVIGSDVPPAGFEHPAQLRAVAS